MTLPKSIECICCILYVSGGYIVIAFLEFCAKFCCSHQVGVDCIRYFGESDCEWNTAGKRNLIQIYIYRSRQRYTKL